VVAELTAVPLLIIDDLGRLRCVFLLPAVPSVTIMPVVRVIRTPF